MPIEAYAVTSQNLSSAWTSVLGQLARRGNVGLGPVAVTVNEFDAQGLPLEDPLVQVELDGQLRAKGEKSIRTVANTIFPHRLWRANEENNAELLLQRYASIWPRVRKHPANRRGVYFQRLTAYSPLGTIETAQPVNQLARIIEFYRGGNTRRSALQAGIFDPTRDHVNVRQLGFPCLQQVAFTPIDGESLAITGFYATQFHFEKAYGNYLGLCWLGRFMAAQLQLRLVRMTCMATQVVIGALSKQEARALLARTVVPATVEDEEIEPRAR